MNAEGREKLSPTEAIERFGRNQPQTYRIVVQGTLGADWSDRLCNLRIQPLSTASPNEPLTVIEGPIVDQAQLSGVLNTLYDLHLKLLEVKLGPEQDPNT